MQKTQCPVCQGAMRLRLPKEPGKKVALACCSPHCQGVRWFNGKGTLEQVRAAGDGTALPGVRHADREAWPDPHRAVLLVLRAVAP